MERAIALRAEWHAEAVVTVDDICKVVLALPASHQVVVRDRTKIRVGRYVYVAFSRDERPGRVSSPKEERASLIAEAGQVAKPSTGDLRYQWIEAWMPLITPRCAS